MSMFKGVSDADLQAGYELLVPLSQAGDFSATTKGVVILQELRRRGVQFEADILDHVTVLSYRPGVF